MRARENSSISRPWTICHSPPSDVTGKDEMRPSGTPYEPSETIAALVQSPSGVPLTHEKTWSIAAFAAEAAEWGAAEDFSEDSTRPIH